MTTSEDTAIDLDALLPAYPATCWDLVEQARDARPDHVFLADDHGRSLTGRQLHDAALGVAAALHARGARRGSVVSWQLPTTLEAMVVMLALSRIGAVQNPIIPVMREREVRFIVDQVGTDLLIVPETWRGFEHGTLARALSSELGFDVLIADHETDPTSVGGALRLELGDPAALPPMSAFDPLGVRWLFHSSGTTADPKGIRHTDRSVMASATGTIVACRVTDADVNPLAFPISHIGGIAMLTASLMTGMRCVLFDTFDQDTAARIAAHRPTMLGSAVPFFLAYFDAQRQHGDDPLFPALRMLVGGGAPVPSEVGRSAREVLGVNGIGNAWGLTEFPVATFPDVDAPPDVLDHTAGRAVPGVRVRVVDGDERELGPGEEGELRLKGPQCFLGYLDPALDVEAFDGDRWFRTGDLGVVDDDGYVRVTGRLKDIIIRNAENISALEVEEAVMRHPAVVDATVLGVADDAVGERVAAVVVLAEGQMLSIDDLARHCRDLGLARHKTPERLEVRDALPRNPMGKVLKQQLRAELA